MLIIPMHFKIFKNTLQRQIKIISELLLNRAVYFNEKPTILVSYDTCILYLDIVLKNAGFYYEITTS